MRTLAILLVAGTLPSATMADTIYGDDGEVLYFGARTGVSLVGDTEFDIMGANVENDYRVGTVFGVMLGFGAEATDTIGVRGELEFGGQIATVDGHDINGAAAAGPFGETRQIHSYINVFGDYQITNDLTAFIGGGVGIASVNFNDHGVTAAGVVMDDSDFGFAYNLGFGVGYEFAPGVVVEGQYRYMGTTGVELTARDTTVSDVDLDSHNLILGVRVGF